MANSITLEQLDNEFGTFITRLEALLQNSASKSSLGLTKVANLGPATRSSAQSPTNHREVLTPAILHFILNRGVISDLNTHKGLINPHGLTAADLDALTDAEIQTYVETYVAQELNKLVIPTYEEIDDAAISVTIVALNALTTNFNAS